MELREEVARVIAQHEVCSGADAAMNLHLDLADAILSLPEIKEALERQVARNLEGRWPDDPRPCEPSQ